MDMNMIKGLVGEQDLNGAVFSSTEINYRFMRGLDGGIICTFVGDPSINTTWKDLEVICIMTSEKHSEYLKACSECPWDKIIDLESTGMIIYKEKYTYEEKAKIEAEKNQQFSDTFVASEKVIALRIEEDYRLELEEISDEQFKEVKQYIKSIQPNSQVKALERPELMFVYEKQMNKAV